MTRAHIYYSGIVQGVGFRYTAVSLARPLGVKGRVKNLADGRVEIIAEGTKESIEHLCEDLEGHFQGSISRKEIDFHEHKATFQDFQISY